MNNHENHFSIQVSDIGRFALEALAQGGEARLIGMTSRGAYLMTAADWVVFLSSEPFRGPLTLNLQNAARFFTFLEKGAVFQAAPGQISLPTSNVILSFDQARVWEAPRLPEKPAQPGAIARRIQQCMKLADRLKANNAEASLYMPKMNEPVYTSARYSSLPKVEQTLADGLGLGEGLTPAGDDLLTGFLLALSRWGHALNPDFETSGLSQRLLALAYRRTTTLSANLIECASRGQADERLILALDSLAAGEPSLKKAIPTLAGWGHSSGFAALDGMILGLKGMIGRSARDL